MNWNDVLQLAKNSPAPPRRVEKTEEEWKRLLTPSQYRVTRLHDTERPFSGEYCEAYSPGIYNCICCRTELFDSTVKLPLVLAGLLLQRRSRIMSSNIRWTIAMECKGWRYCAMCV